MNKARRAAIQAAINKINEVIEEQKSELESLRDEEQDYFDNLPENMQGGEKGSQAEYAIEALTNYIDSLDEINSGDVESECGL